MAKQRNKRPQHEFAVIGLGRFGSSLATNLSEIGYTVLGIDRRPELVQAYADRLTQTVVVDATDEGALQEIGIQQFDTVIVAIGTDFESNLMTTVALKGLGVRRVICKAVTERQKAILLRIGADQVVLPEMEAGQRLAQDLASPSILSQIHLSPEYAMVELRTPQSLVGQSLREADIRSRFGLTVLVISREGQLIVSPQADFRLVEGDVLMVIGKNTDVAHFGAAV